MESVTECEKRQKKKKRWTKVTPAEGDSSEYTLMVHIAGDESGLSIQQCLSSLRLNLRIKLSSGEKQKTHWLE